MNIYHYRPLKYYAFYLKYYRAHPDLHSFPTRRSSDLETAVTNLPIPRTDPFTCNQSAMVELDGAHVRLLVCHSDRKSTRLNSSHLGISYAVFCLKKTKKNKYVT